MMDSGAETGLSAQVAAAFEWWRDAGVDCEFQDVPRQWIAPETAENGQVPQFVAPIFTAPEPPPPPPVGGEQGEWPGNLEEFTQWWMTEPTLGNFGGHKRVPPRGPANADVMVIIPTPEKDDADRLLSGPQGRLLDAMLLAMGIAPETAYIASALPAHTPFADWEAIHSSAMPKVLAHHIALVAPRQILAFDEHVLPLLGHTPAHNSNVLTNFNQNGVTVPLFTAAHLETFLLRPGAKAGLWRRWIERTGCINES